jgi:hypothetical protein
MSDLFEFNDYSPIGYARRNKDQFTDDFLAWLPLNLHIYRAFEIEAFTVIGRGYKHYSAKTIIEFLRHHSAMTESAGEFKINNNISPYLPRLFDLVNPECVGLWEYRETKKVIQQDV